MQQNLALLGNVKQEIKNLPDQWVACCSTEQDAMRLCVNKSNVYRSQDDLADVIGISKSRLNRMLNADKSNQPLYMSRKLQIALQGVCGNRAIDQWADLYSRGLLNCQRTREDRKAELLRELQQLEAQA